MSNAVSAELPSILPAWIWSAEPSQYVLFHRRWQPSGPVRELTITISAATTYELYVDGRFIHRGPVHGDPGWTSWDVLSVTRDDPASAVELAVVVHNAGPEARVSCVVPAPGGLALHCAAGEETLTSDEQWRALPLAMWRSTGKRGWALGWGEDYDARLEPAGWAAKRFVSTAWPAAVRVADAPWQGHHARPVPLIDLGTVAPVGWWVGNTPAALPLYGEASTYADSEPLSGAAVADLAAVNAALAAGANAVTVDLGAEHVGHYEFSINAPAGTVIDVAGCELLRDGRPWIMRKGTSYTVRYTAAGGPVRFRSFLWSGFRWLHLIVRSDGPVQLHALQAATRNVRLGAWHQPHAANAQLQAISELCHRTLAVGVQEHLIDCPTREQAQYWGDGVFIAQALAVGCDEPAYLRFYLDAFIAVPFTAEGQIPSVYPGRHVTLLDYSLIPLIAQRFHRANYGSFHRPAETLAKARQLKRWYDARRDADGLLRQLHDTAAQPTLLTFIDHPGLGWHDFPHTGIARDGRSAGLNLFFLLFVRTLAELAEALGAADAVALRQQEHALAQAIRAAFFDGTVMHDTERDGARSPGTSWQSNALAVLAGIVSPTEATVAMHRMLAGYDELCRCSPYFHFYFLPALQRAGLVAEAKELIVREWQPMLAAGATTTWEGFAGDAKDTLCHPWSTAPYLFLLGLAEPARCAWPD